MKNLVFRFFPIGAALAALVLAGGGSPQSLNAQTAASAVAATNSIALENAGSPAIPAALPSNILPSSPLGQVVRLTQAGVDQSIIMTFVTNSTHTFNLDSDKIIYLTDLGAPSDLVTAMMGRDQQLQNQFTAAQAAQQAQQIQPAETTPPGEPPAPTNTAEVATQPETPAPVTVDYFNDTLQPYGSWVVVNGYGRCWRPTVCVYDSSWQPYCNRGSWVYSDCGWYWNSDYAWGATFHYGRWFRAAGYGWCWYPDTVWAPSWVTWRYSNNYCGWAPLPPRTTYQAGVGIVYNGGGVSVGFGFGLGANCFSFVPTRYFCSPNPRNYCVAPGQVAQIYNNTTVINNFNFNRHTVVNNGIAVGNIATAAHAPIHQVPVRDINAGNVHGGHGQPFNHYGNMPGPNHHSSSENFSNPARTQAALPSRSAFNSATDQHQPQRNPVVATIPQRSMESPSNRTQMQSVPARFSGAPNQTGQQRNQVAVTAPSRPATGVNYRPATLPSVQTPASDYRQPTASSIWQQIGAPRSYASQPNRSPSPAVMAQSHSAPQTSRNYSQQNYRSAAPMFASAQPWQGGNQRGPGR